MSIISILRTRLTARKDRVLLIERHDGTYFLGDLDAAKRVLLDEYGDCITEWKADNGMFVVAEHRGSDRDNPNQWGKAWTSDEAWRYLAGADFGPIDSEYDEGALRSALTSSKEA